MKSRSKELLDRAIAATVAAIEIYNKPDFLYREEAFSVMAVNGWELLLKAKWLTDNNNNIRSLYVREFKTNRDGKKGKQLRIRTTRSGNPFTHSIEYLAKKMVQGKVLDVKAWDNIQALLELRDSAIHFYNHSGGFAQRLQEIGAACLKNFVAAVREWFGRDMSEFNFYLMPLSFVALPSQVDGIVLNAEEKNFLAFIESLESEDDDAASAYSVTVNIDIKFTRSKAKDALAVQVTNDPKAPSVRLTEEQIREKYPWDYDELTSECRKRYADFKIDKEYHDLRKKLLSDTKYGVIRYLDPGNPKSQRKPFFSPIILNALDGLYVKSEG
ncbi:MAG TPA: DUF3644 domain-containing protein [Dissulfurispiraceae bacterium]|nr:DUF3644 domain-containing protein [Dissulfurispiraceae bacterium]